MTLSITMLRLVLSVVMLNVAFIYYYAECRCANYVRKAKSTDARVTDEEEKKFYNFDVRSAAA